MNKFLKTIFYLFFPLIIGGIVGFSISNSIDYTNLVRPPLSPPKILFPIAWTIIYLLMGLSYYIYKKKYEEYDYVDTIYYLQLFVNCLWSFIFFVWKWRFIAIIWIILLWLLVALLIWLFYHRKPISAYLNIPYLIWVSFATYLTIGIYVLNK